MFSEFVLLVDDEPNILKGYQRSLRKKFRIKTAEGGKRALEIMADDGPFAAIVADMRMPEMNGTELLEEVKGEFPDIVRLMLTGNSDQQTAIDAVNKGAIFRFLNKPCSSEELTRALTDAIHQHRLITAERELLEKTLKGSVKVLVDLLSLADQRAFTHGAKLRRRLRETGIRLGFKVLWEMEVAAMLRPLGILTLPDELKIKLDSNQELTEKEKQALEDIPGIGKRLLESIPRLETVAELVGLSGEKAIESLDEGTREKASLFLVLSELVNREDNGLETIEALNKMEAEKTSFTAEMVKRVKRVYLEDFKLTESNLWKTLEVKAKELIIGDVLRSKLMTLSGKMLLAEGTRITGAFLEKIRNYRKLEGLVEPVAIKRRGASRHERVGLR